MIAILLVTALTLGDAAPPWLAQVGDRTDVTAVHATAAVTVSDGLTYEAITVYEGPDRASFQRVYADGTVGHRIEDGKVWEFDGETETEAAEFFGTFVMGHQIHAQILFFDHIHPGLQDPQPAQFGDDEAFVVWDGGEFTWRLYYDADGLPLGMGLPREEAPPIVYAFEDWREVDGVRLPYAVFIDDGERQFYYVFASIEIRRP